MSDIPQMTVALQRLVGFLSMVTNSPLLSYATNSSTRSLPWNGNQQTVAQQRSFAEYHSCGRFLQLANF
jgi:hypothetical protein